MDRQAELDNVFTKSRQGKCLDWAKLTQHGSQLGLHLR